MIHRKINFIIFSLLLTITLSFISFSKAEPEGISYKEEFDNITITTDYLTLKINGLNPHFIWWNNNIDPAGEIYNLKFISIKEFFGDDDILDNPLELGGIAYDLSSGGWSHELTILPNSLTIELTLSGLANGAEIQFIITVFNEDKVINGTDHILEALTAVKIDIIINNWDFSVNAAGLALFTYVFESQENPAVQIRAGTPVENGNASEILQFQSESYNNNKIAFFEWTTFANVYDGLALVDNVTVRKASLVEGLPISLPVSPSMIPIYITYPNYGNSLKMVHDPSVGIYLDNYSISVNALSIINGLMLIMTLVFIRSIKRTSNKHK
ncbi:MAG: hypothetical protein JXA54_11540 [Candidatus Heimdallarchaeota archaeon]|nr:hypothetical protein [Candidatus Heimdallarchaeota archaeon]